MQTSPLILISKKATILILLNFVLLGGLYATTITVSKDPNRVAQFTDIQTAIDDVNTAIGDTILVYGSSNNYGNVDVYKTLVLIGEGYYNNGNSPATISDLKLSRFNAAISGSASTVLGFSINSLTFAMHYANATNETRILEDITIMRCDINSIAFYANQYSGFEGVKLDNVNLINCLVRGQISVSQSNNELIEDITFSNCIFDSADLRAYLSRNQFGGLDKWESLTNVKFYNSLFLNATSGLLHNTVGAVFENNIFFGHELYLADYAQITWNHNLFYLIDQSPLGTNDNTGSGNLIDQDPMFTTYPSTGGAFSYDHDYHLKAGSPALTAGLNGEEIGIYGGAYPFAIGANPPVPVVTEVTIQDGTSSVPVGGTINFNFKAKSGE